MTDKIDLTELSDAMINYMAELEAEELADAIALERMRRLMRKMKEED